MFNEINEWLSQRCGKFTSSEIHKLMGKGRGGDYFGLVAKSYIMTRAAEILTGEPANQRNPTMAMEWGHAHEFEAITKYQEQYGQVEYYGGQNPMFVPYSTYCGGSPDGTSSNEVIEIKCPFNSSEHLQHWLLKDAEALKDYAPKYYWQITANMIFCNKTHGVFISFDPRFDIQYQLKVLKFKCNLDDANFLTERIKAAEEELQSILSKL